MGLDGFYKPKTFPYHSCLFPTQILEQNQAWQMSFVKLLLDKSFAG